MASPQQKKEPIEIRRIVRRRLSDVVYEQIREAILNRRFQPGERLSIPDLAARFDVSLMPVRQAVERLHDDGLVEVRPRSGTYVAEVDARDIAETFDVRRALEVLAAQTAVEHVSEQDLNELRDLVAQMEELTCDGEPDLEGHDRLNSEFHRSIIALSGNQKLADIYDELHAHLKIARVHLSSRDWLSRVERENAEHGEILEALERRDADALAEALSRHIARSKEALIADIERSRRSPESTDE